MILIPQVYLKAGRAVPLDNTSFNLFSEDAFAMAKAMTDAGCDALYIVDLNVTPVGTSSNLPIIKKIKNDLKCTLFVGGAFRSAESATPYMNAGADLVVLDAHAYQQPRIVEETCAKHPKKVAVHIDVRDGRVTIPGWTVAANKTAFDYAERFREQGVATFFYSNMSADDSIDEGHLEELLTFCKKVQKPVYTTNEIAELADIEKLVTLGAPRLDGLILSRALYQGRFDLTSANAYVADMMQDSNNEPTLHDLD